MEKIIIFTNYNSLGNVSVNSRQKISFIDESETLISIDINKHFAEHKFFKYLGQSKFQVVQDINVGNIFLIYDSISYNDFDLFLKSYDKNKIGILWHLNDSKFTINVNGLINKKGEHEATGKYYPKMLEIFSDGAGNEFERLKEKVFKYNPELEAALEFLHKSLDNKFADPNILTAGRLFDINTKIPDNSKKTLDDLIQNNEHKEHKEALKDIRDALLSIALPSK